jgi:hypothetical protein
MESVLWALERGRGRGRGGGKWGVRHPCTCLN